MKLDIKRRTSSGLKSVGRAAKSVGRLAAKALPAFDRESLVIRRKGKHLKIRNGMGKANITFHSVERAKEAARAVIDPAEIAINDSHLALTSK